MGEVPRMKPRSMGAVPSTTLAAKHVQDVVELFEGLCGLPPLPIMISSHCQCLKTL